MGLENCPMKVTSQHGKNCQFTPYWPYIKYMLKIEVTTYPKAQSMHGIEV